MSRLDAQNNAPVRRSTRDLATARTRIARKWDRGERGAALVEAAIVFLPLCLIVFGIIEYGFIFKDSLTISSATRAGARTASAEPKVASFFDDAVAAVTQAGTGVSPKTGDTLFIYKVPAGNTTGLPESNDINVCGADCREYHWGAGKWNLYGDNFDLNNVSACQGSADSVGVRIQVSHDALSGFFHDLKLTEKTVMRLEPLTSGNCS